MRFALGELVYFEPEGYGERLRAHKTEICAFCAETLFVEVHALRTCAVGLAAGVGQGDFIVGFYFDVGFLAIGGEAKDLRECAHALAGNLHETAVFAELHLAVACAVVHVAVEFQRVTADIGKAVYRYAYACFLKEFRAVAVEELPCARFVVRVYIRHFERFIGLNRVLADLDVVAVNVRACVVVLAPSNLGVALVVEGNGCHAEAHLNRARAFGEVKGHIVIQACPRGSEAHEDGVATFLLCIEFEECRVHVEVVAGRAGGLAVGHVEDNLAVYAFLAECQHLAGSDNRAGGRYAGAAHDRELAEVEVEVFSAREVQGNEGNGLACQLAAYGELALYPSVLIGFVVGCEEVHAALVDSHALIAECGEHEVHAGLTAVELVAHGNHVAALQGVFRLEEVEVFVGCRAENAEAGTAYVGIVPNKFCVQSAGGHVGSVAAEELRGKPPAPRGQIVLHANVVPRTVVLLHALPVEELTVTEVEVRDKRLFAQIPLHGAAGGHERRHAVERKVIGIVLHRTGHGGAVGRVARAARKPAFRAEHIGALLHVGGTALFAAAFPEHIFAMCAPKAY